MAEQVYQCEPTRFIHCYAATHRYIFIVESSLENSYRADLLYINYADSTSVNKSSYPINLSRTSVTAPSEGSLPIVRSLQIVSVPLIKKNAALETMYYLIVNTGDGIQICTLEDIIANHQTHEVTKWSHGKIQDCIVSLYAQGYKDGSIMMTYCTYSGSIVQCKFNTSTGTFNSLELAKYLENCQDKMMDRINNISGLRNFGQNYPSPSQEKLWTSISSKKAMVFSCLDNNIYTVVDGNLEFQPYYNLDENMDNSEQLLTWADFAIVKQYSSSSLSYYALNITNLGCVLYKRSNRGQWDMIRVLRREHETPERSPLVDCLIQLHNDNPNEFFILSGSECGKLYQWRYNFRDDSIVDLSTSVGGNKSIVHSLSVAGRDKVFFLDDNNTIIKYIYLY